MSLGENVNARLTYKPYATGVITSNSQPVSATDPAATGGQILRRTTCTLDLAKDTFESGENRPDLQVGDMRHGLKRVQGSIMGELSPGTYFDFMEAACRGTKASAVALSNTDLTSVAFDSTTGTATFGGGNPVTLGLRVGHILNFTNCSEAANNSTNFTILGFSGGSNRDVLISPAPTTQTADTTFNVTTVGKSVIVPSSSFVKRKFGVEVYHSDLDSHRFFTECRVGGMKLALPPSGMATVEFPMMGRDMETATGGSSPFFTNPTAQTTTGLLAAVNGLLRLGGSTVGVVTGLSIDMDLSSSTDPVVGQSYGPEIFLGRARVSGQVTAFLEDFTLLNYFKNENEVEILSYLTASSAAAAQAITILLPRVKFKDADIGLEGEAGIPITLPFTALKYETSVATDGIENTTIQICDTAAA